MRNTFGNSLTVTLFGESHGEAIGACLDGVSPGIRIDYEYINKALSKRRPSGICSTSRVETDEYEIISGVYNGYTTGAPLTAIIKNTNTKSSDYESLKDIPRPSHADYTATCKYGGYSDYRGGGHFSGRLTAPLVLVGAILRSALLQKGIKIGTHICELHGAFEEKFGVSPENEIKILAERDFPTVTVEAEKRMREEIEKARGLCDSVGGILESTVIGLPAGLGEPWFDSAESLISHVLFSIPGIKGVEFGLGFAMSDVYGSEANDSFVKKDGRVMTLTNNAAGINGGITNGMPIIVRCAVRPTPSISKEQITLNLKSGESEALNISGRHDPAIVHRAAPVVDAMLSIAVADMLTTKFGTDYLGAR